MKKLIIIGTGGFAREVVFHAQNSLGFKTEWDLKGFLDGDVKLPEEEYKKLKLPLLGDVKNYEIEKDDVFICAIADPKVRERLTKIIEDKGGEFMTLIHRTALVSPDAKIGHGCIITAFALIMPDSFVGNHVIFNCRAGNSHDSRVGDFCSFMGNSGIMGNVTVGHRVYFAGGAKALPHAVIEDDAYVGVDSTVFKRVKRGRKVFGVPAVPVD